MPDAADRVSDARGVIERALDEKIDKELLDRLFENVLTVEKQARGYCGTCKRAVMVTIPDAKAVISALNELLVQAKGRPGQAEASVEDRTFVFENRIVLVADDQ